MRRTAVLFLLGFALACAVVGVIAASVYLEFAFALDTNYVVPTVAAVVLVACVGFAWGIRTRSRTIRVLHAAAMATGFLAALFVVTVAPVYAGVFQVVFITWCGAVGLLGGVAFRESRNR